jgi:hypothetical protein
MIDPDEVAAALWLASADPASPYPVSESRRRYATWADVPENVKEVWRGSFVAFAGALERAGYDIVKQGEPRC